ncbi:phosphonatase-like hydrolase [Nocardiopsis suaedae]|uniref:Phosphonatase-like hydrolase n=1 Tax=Nocardiopsis suaedae TaxID=3018444 RepID=A0ABT4TQX0_9ACTN|nr:phosphonatase-like hydrolase [Nocardiopsis suaedae]MDA2807085.1 phosphonatase-like hydrolase [Nocardiopsis suaedae]
MRADGNAPPPAVRLVVCDMAGTAVADEGLVEHAFDAAAREAGVAPGGAEHTRMRRYVQATMGASKIAVFRDLFGDEERARTANAAFERAYAEAVGQGHCAPVPGAEEAMDRLRSQGRAVVLTTGFAPATRDAVVDALGWRGRVDGALSPADAGRGRPYPDLVLAALLRTGAADAVREVAVVGDTRSDVTAGRRAGAGLVAGVLTGAHGEDDLRGAGADAVLGSVAELPDLLRDRGL